MNFEFHHDTIYRIQLEGCLDVGGIIAHEEDKILKNDIVQIFLIKMMIIISINLETFFHHVN